MSDFNFDDFYEDEEGIEEGDLEDEEEEVIEEDDEGQEIRVGFETPRIIIQRQQGVCSLLSLYHKNNETETFYLPEMTNDISLNK